MKLLAMMVVGCVLFLSSCAPYVVTSISKHYSPLEDRAEVRVLELQDSVPNNVEELGVVRIDDAGLSVNCGWDEVLGRAKIEARKVGGNVIKITEHIPPSIFGSSCHRIVAKILRVENFDDIPKTAPAVSLPTTTAYTSGATISVVSNEPYSRFRIAINGGWSWRVAEVSSKLPPVLQQYVQNLKSGYHYGAEVSHYPSEELGFGLKYYVFQSKNQMDDVSLTLPDGSVARGKISDDIAINFIGALFCVRMLNADQSNSLLMNAGLGYMGYMGYMGYANDATVVTPFTIKGSTLGLCLDIGYDIGITKNVAIGGEVSYLAGVLRQYELSDDDGHNTRVVKLEKENYESLHRIDVSLGLRFNL